MDHAERLADLGPRSLGAGSRGAIALRIVTTRDVPRIGPRDTVMTDESSAEFEGEAEGAALERALIVRIRDGDPTACEAIFRAYYAPLFAFVRGYVHSEELAEEAVQEIFLRIWTNRERLDPYGGALKTYLYKAARNQALDMLKHRRIEWRWAERTRQRQSGDDLSAGPIIADDALHATDLATAIDRAIAALPERCRLIFTMSREHGLSYAEIANVLGISIKTVETQIGRALKSLRARLVPWMDDSDQ